MLYKQETLTQSAGAYLEKRRHYLGAAILRGGVQRRAPAHVVRLGASARREQRLGAGGTRYGPRRTHGRPVQRCAAARVAVVHVCAGGDELAHRRLVANLDRVAQRQDKLYTAILAAI